MCQEREPATSFLEAMISYGSSLGGRNDLVLFDVGHRGRIFGEMNRLQGLRLHDA